VEEWLEFVGGTGGAAGSLMGKASQRQRDGGGKDDFAAGGREARNWIVARVEAGHSQQLNAWRRTPAANNFKSQ